MRELGLHLSIVDALRRLARPDVVWWHCPNGEARTKRVAAKLKKMGVRAGVADLQVSLPDGRFGFMEIKADNGRVSHEQRDFLARMSARGVVADVAEGTAEAPFQIVGGIADAFNAFVGIGDIAQVAIPLPGFQLFSKDAEFDPKFVSEEEVTAEMRARSDAPTMLPTTDRGDTVTGNAIRGMAQFLTPFTASKAIGTGAGALYARGMFSDFVGFDGHEARLSDLIQSNPQLANPVTKFLASDENDSELEGRLKNVVEGGLNNLVLSSVFISSQTIRERRNIALAARYSGRQP